MIAIKIECGCGQHYAFDVEPVEGRMPTAVACPTCGADGTEAANAVIARSLAAEPTVAAPPPPSAIRVASAAPVPTAARPRALARAARTDRAQVEHEARAKVMWGSSREEVLSCMMMQGLSHEEASALAQSLFRERAASIRANGIRKILIGAPLVCVPFVAFSSFKKGVLTVRLFALTVMVGAYGAYMLINGIIMFLTPKSEPGDVGEQ